MINSGVKHSGLCGKPNVMLKELQQFTFKLVICLDIADYCKGFAWLLSPDELSVLFRAS
jgi:hypothetical protein